MRLICSAAILLTLAVTACTAGNDSDSHLQQDSTPAAPTQYQRRLTGAEAAELVKADLRAKAEAQGLSPATAAKITCEAQDFNEGTTAWIVHCVNPDTNANATVRVDDATGEISPIE